MLLDSVDSVIKTKDNFFKKFQKKVLEMLGHLVLLPWTIPLIAWICITILIVVINSNERSNIAKVVTTDYANTFSPLLGWIVLSMCFLLSFFIDFHYFRYIKTFRTTAITLLMILFIAFLFLLWEEVLVYVSLNY